MKKFFLCFTVLFILIDISLCQTRRIVLIEEATNASCAPCAANNPIFQQFMSQNFGGAISVRYHAWWPGADPMYSQNTTDNTARINYYGITGVPNYALDGTKYGVPGDAEAMASQMRNRLALKSPVKIEITTNITSDSVRATVKLIGISIVTQTNLVLRTAIIERLVKYATPPGNNGEREFPDVMRKLLPDANGISIAGVTVGQTYTYYYSYPVTSPWNWQDLAVVSWLQSDATKEIIQSNISIPTCVLETKDRLAEFIAYNQTYVKQMKIFNDNPSTINVRVKNILAQVPAGWSYKIIYQSVVYDSLTINIAPNDSANFQVEVTTGGNSGTIKLTFLARNINDPYGYGSSLSYLGVIKNGDILFVDDDGGRNSEVYFKEAFDSIGVNFTNFEQAYIDQLSSEILTQNFKAVFWSVGWGFPAFVSSDINFLKTYLDGGGKLFISGQDIGWDVFDPTGSSTFQAAKDFYNNYLDARYLEDNAAITSMEGIPGTLGDGLNFAISPVAGNFYPEVISSFRGLGTLFLKYTGSTKYGAINYATSIFKTVYLGVGLEQISTAIPRRKLISKILDWFGFIIPVELTSFTALSVGNNIVLNWTTATETNNLGFEVQRKSGDEFLTIGYVRGTGTTTQTQNYSYSDNELASGSYTYRLKQVDYNGVFEFSNIVEVTLEAPKVFSLEQNYPNPFNPSTKINFNLAVDSKVVLKIFNVLGEEVTTLVNGYLSAGSHKVDFNATNLNNGVYIYKLEAVGIDGSTFSDVKKMTLIK